MNWTNVIFYFSGLGLVPILLSYSFLQEKFLPMLYEIEAGSGIKHILKAMSGLYVANVLVFLLTAMGYIPVETGLLVLIIFMIGLAFGRLVSFICDGERRFIFILYFVLEVILGGAAFIALRAI